MILTVLHGVDDNGVHDHGSTVEAVGGVDLSLGNNANQPQTRRVEKLIKCDVAREAEGTARGSRE